MNAMMTMMRGMGLLLLVFLPTACTTTTTTTSTASVHGDVGTQYRSATMPHELLTRR